MLTLLSYIDPGSGLMLTQIIAAGICGILISLRKVRLKIAQLFHPKKNDTSDKDL